MSARSDRSPSLLFGCSYGDGESSEEERASLVEFGERAEVAVRLFGGDGCIGHGSLDGDVERSASGARRGKGPVDDWRGPGDGRCEPGRGREIGQATSYQRMPEPGEAVPLHSLEDFRFRCGSDVRTVVRLAENHPPARSQDAGDLIDDLLWIAGVDEDQPGPARVERTRGEREHFTVGDSNRHCAEVLPATSCSSHRRGTIDSDRMAGALAERFQVDTGATTDIEHPVVIPKAEKIECLVRSRSSLVLHPPDEVGWRRGAVEMAELSDVDHGNRAGRHS